MTSSSSASLSICGDVERPACLGLEELRSLPDAELVADFHCHEGWSRPGERWRGVRFSTLLGDRRDDRARPARTVTARG